VPFFPDTGQWLRNLTSLLLTGVHLQGDWLKVTGRGEGADRAFGSGAQRTLMSYICHYRHPLDRKSRHLHIRRAAAQPLARFGSLNWLSDTSDLTRVYPHPLCHTFALNYIVSVGDVFNLRRFSGTRRSNSQALHEHDLDTPRLAAPAVLACRPVQPSPDSPSMATRGEQQAPVRDEVSQEARVGSKLHSPPAFDSTGLRRL